MGVRSYHVTNSSLLKRRQNGCEILSCHQFLTSKKGTEKHVLEQPANMWQGHPDSCEIFSLLTSSWLMHFCASFLKLFSSETAPYLWYSLNMQGTLSDMRNDSAIGSKLLKSCCPSADALRS